jgi:hypothetical protein
MWMPPLDRMKSRFDAVGNEAYIGDYYRALKQETTPWYAPLRASLRMTLANRADATALLFSTAENCVEMTGATTVRRSRRYGPAEHSTSDD